MKKVVQAARDAVRAFQQKYNERGEEMPDPTPVEVPLGFRKPPTLHEQIKMFIRTEEFRRAAAREGVENFEEANDFELGDEEFDEVPTVHEMQEEFIAQARKDADAYVERAKAAVEKRRKETATPPTPPAPASSTAKPDAE